ncbi:hypothetical protein NKH18_48130 [Streptomyces sp. M10(2022)]
MERRNRIAQAAATRSPQRLTAPTTTIPGLRRNPPPSPSTATPRRPGRVEADELRTDPHHPRPGRPGRSRRCGRRLRRERPGPRRIRHLPHAAGVWIRLPFDLGRTWENEHASWAAEMLTAARYHVDLDQDLRVAPPSASAPPAQRRTKAAMTVQTAPRAPRGGSAADPTPPNESPPP